MYKSRFHYNCFKQTDNNEFQLTQFGYHKWTPTTKNTKALKDCYVLHIVLNGKGFYRVRHKQVELCKNKAFLLPPTELVEYGTYPDDCLEYVWIGLTGNGIEEFLKNSGFAVNNYVVELKDVETLKDICWQMIKHNVGVTPDYFLMSKTYEFLDVFNKNLLKWYGDSDLQRERIFKEAINYIRKNYNNNITVSDMCKELCMERSGLFKRFKKEFGVSPQNYIIQYRLNIAENMITQTTMSVTEIAQECGFNSYPHFCKIFKANYGVSPQKYRNEKLKNN